MENEREDTAPEEVEAHAEVENIVKISSPQYFPDKDIAWNDRDYDEEIKS